MQVSVTSVTGRDGHGVTISPKAAKKPEISRDGRDTTLWVSRRHAFGMAATPTNQAIGQLVGPSMWGRLGGPQSGKVALSENFLRFVL